MIFLQSKDHSNGNSSTHEHLIGICYHGDFLGCSGISKDTSGIQWEYTLRCHQLHGDYWENSKVNGGCPGKIGSVQGNVVCKWRVSWEKHGPKYEIFQQSNRVWLADSIERWFSKRRMYRRWLERCFLMSRNATSTFLRLGHIRSRICKRNCTVCIFFNRKKHDHNKESTHKAPCHYYTPYGICENNIHWLSVFFPSRKTIWGVANLWAGPHFKKLPWPSNPKCLLKGSGKVRKTFDKSKKVWPSLKISHFHHIASIESSLLHPYMEVS